MKHFVWKPVAIDGGDFVYNVTKDFDRAHHFSLSVSGPTSMLREPWMTIKDYFGRASIPLPDSLRLCNLVEVEIESVPADVRFAAGILGGIVTGNVLSLEDYKLLTTIRKWIRDHE